MAGIDEQHSWWTSAGTIRRGMTVLDPDAVPLGTVDHVEGEEIHLADTPNDDARSFILASQVDGIDGDTVLLSRRGDATFGEGALP
ncbi:DUF2171 domain-containing protein [Novosphingobium sp. 9]|uniref:DUF2171 domain-containing protein n=1 Tax=Novosphingobium sp. 9 TaxID=2025349 RepID=UPI0021B693DA|nr:DUF2171 domain-containing protein [Novosphingobium sp. 9]